MTKDRERLWQEAVKRAKKVIDAVAGEAVDGGWMEPTVPVHVGTILAVDSDCRAAIGEGKRKKRRINHDPL